jgi:transcriptional regulator with XRE-family HTH domain
MTRKRYNPAMSKLPSKTEIFVANVNALVDGGEISISEIARRAGVNRVNVSLLLSGKQGVTIERAEKIAKAIALPLEDLIGGVLTPSA